MSEQSQANQYTVQITDTGEAYPCAAEESLLKAMARLGRKGIPSGCHGGGCGVCKIQILSGECLTQAMSRAHVTAEEEKAGFALACRCYPGSDVTVKVVGKMHKSVCRRYGFV